MTAQGGTPPYGAAQGGTPPYGTPWGETPWGETPSRMSAREAMLRRVRASLSDVPRSERPEDVPVPRAYAVDRDVADVLGLFLDRVADYRATVRRARSADVAAAVSDALSRRGARRVVVPSDLPATWLPAGPTWLADEPSGALGPAALDAADGVVTGCAVGIAETGTIVLDAGPAQGRRALTLLPDYHLCLVRAEQVVATVPEALARLQATRPLTFVSGPSATSDIELDRVEGVHGPRTLDVLLVLP